MEELHPFGPHFKTWRERRRLSLKEAAGDIITPQALSQFENGNKFVSLANLSRLLLAIGVDWLDFLYDYQGARMASYTYLVSDYILNNTPVPADKLQDIKAIYQDNPQNLEILDIILDHYRSDSLIIISEKKSHLNQEQLVNQVLKKTAHNPLETEFVLRILHKDQLTEEQLFLLLDIALKDLQKTIQTDNGASYSYLASSVRLLTALARNLSRREHYQKVEKLIETTLKELEKSKHAGLVQTYPLLILELDMQKTFNLIRQGKRKEAQPLIDKINAYLDAVVAYDFTSSLTHRCIQYKYAFTSSIKDLLDKRIK